jgi:manganese/zinc/iron transport system ATP- binding protein
MFSYSHRHHADPLANAPALDIAGLQVVYPQTRLLALQDVHLCLNPGERVALVGHNGAGKSTLMKTIAGLLRPQKGRLHIYGREVGECHHRVAYLPQRGEMDWRFPITLARLVMTGRYVHLGWFRWPGPADQRIVREVLARLGLEALAGRQISQLSGGQQQRALIARALAQESDLLLLDEPFNAVDQESRGIIMEVLEGLRGQGKTVLMATHDLSRLANDFDRALAMQEGQIRYA